MTETKTESQNTFANLYNSVGSLPFEYVISAIPFHETSFFLAFAIRFDLFRVLA